ncbi:hypothetical protein CgunFtcFv8_002441 [Champsocephalus gunnari]|uniref:FAM21/CAPZIP domain-containing protein n=1 Tax=Champsocephalus gunnari TaxID=52237 RepID=A0AAN8D8P4_CHAGU|nr:hypothetical protein CgunFtcFv8_002441 [Champsocephalus gunnari]
MEEEAAPRRSVSELAGRFKKSPAAHDAAGTETEKPVRRRPPRSLDLQPPGDQQPPGVTSPLPAKAKRNSALIEKLQMNLSLAPSPKSPGFRMLPPFSPPPSPGLAPPSPGHAPPASVATVTPTSPIASSPLAEEEGPASFEAPPTAGDGAILSNSNIKSRARHSIRRRPPSRRHRTSSTEEREQEGGATSPEKHDTNEEEESTVSVESREEEKKKKEEDEGDSSSSGRTGEEDKQEAATNTESTEEEEKETSSSSR